jgi:hypothetical protein
MNQIDFVLLTRITARVAADADYCTGSRHAAIIILKSGLKLNHDAGKIPNAVIF